MAKRRVIIRFQVLTCQHLPYYWPFVRGSHKWSFRAFVSRNWPLNKHTRHRLFEIPWRCGYVIFISSQMIASSNGNIFRVTGHLCREFTCHRLIPRTKASEAELWCFLCLRLNKRLSKQSWCWWFETPSRPLWRHRNDNAASLYGK